MMRDMTKGAPLGHLFLYAVPLLLGNWLQLAYNAVDSIIAGRFIGQDALAAEGGYAADYGSGNRIHFIHIAGVHGAHAAGCADDQADHTGADGADHIGFCRAGDYVDAGETGGFHVAADGIDVAARAGFA